MLAQETSLSSAAAFVTEVFWGMEQKVDGHRVLAKVEKGRIIPYNRNGEPYSKNFPSGEAQLLLKHFRVGDIVDGELVGGRFWAFDLPFRSGTDYTSNEYTMRRAHLRSREYPYTLPVARLPEAKAELMRKVRDEGGEGVIIKHLYAPYEPGVRSSKMLKAKYVKTIDCIVSSLNRNGREAIGLSVLDDRELVEVGACSTIGKPSVELGDVVLIRYLYATDPEAPRLVQPTLIEVRDDKPPNECTIDQVKYTSKIVLP